METCNQIVKIAIFSSQDKTRQDKTFIIKISPVQFLGTQLAEKR